MKNNVLVEELFEYRLIEKRKLVISLWITASVMIIEFGGGIFANSVALISDAWHMFTHCLAIGISLAAVIIARNPPCHHRTFGLYRAEILAAFINGLFLILVVAVIVYESIYRIIHPVNILGFYMFLIALLGLVVDLASVAILQINRKSSLNVKSMFYHLIGDAASSVGVVAAALIIMFTGWKIIDPLVSIGISLVMLFWAWGILRQSARILLEMAPEGLDTEAIGNDLKLVFPEIKELFNVHLWTITTDMFVFAAHVQLKDIKGSLPAHQELIMRINSYMARKYNIIETTIQLITGPGGEVCNIDPGPSK